MKHMSITLSIAVLLLAATGSALAQGTIVLQHSGATDPATEGFSFGGSGLVGPVINDLGMDAWITAVSAPNQSTGYFQSLTAQQNAQLTGSDWVMSLTLRVVESPPVLGNNWVSFGTGPCTFDLFFGSESDGDPFVTVYNILNTSDNQQFVLQGGGPGYHNYQLVYSAALDTADLWVDGVQRLSDLLPIQSPTQASSYGVSNRVVPRRRIGTWYPGKSSPSRLRSPSFSLAAES